MSREIAGQTQQTFRNLNATLAATGASLDDVIRVGVYLVDMSDFEPMNEVYEESLDEPYPARTTLFVDLPSEMKVEIDALAVIPAADATIRSSGRNS